MERTIRFGWSHGKLPFAVASFFISATFLAGLALAVGSSPVLAFSGNGSGTSGDPYQISTCEQLQSINSNLSADYELTQDIDCSGSASLNGGSGFMPIGTGSSFSGKLDGQSHAITNLTITGDSSSTLMGIFSTLSGTALVENLDVLGGSVTGGTNVGMIVGEMQDSSELLSVSSSASVDCITNNGGGLVGSMQDTSSMLKSYSTGDVSGAGYTYGGLVGWANGASSSPGIVMTNVYHRGEVTLTSGTGPYVGGLVGESTYLNLNIGYDSGSISGHSEVGGIIGGAGSSTITNTFSAASISYVSDGGPIMGQDVSTTANNNYFDTNITGFVTDATTGAMAITNSAYFYDSSNAAFANWSFPNVWRENYLDYPSFPPTRPPQMECGQSAITKSSIRVHCQITPPGWGTPTWVMRYKKTTDSTWTAVHLNDIHVDNATITGLTSGTSYSIEFRFTNTWGTGPWGTINAKTTGVAPAVKKVATPTASISNASNDTITFYPASIITHDTSAPPLPDSSLTQSSQVPSASAAPSTAAPDASSNNKVNWRTVRATLGAGFVIIGFLILFGIRPKLTQAAAHDVSHAKPKTKSKTKKPKTKK